MLTAVPFYRQISLVSPISDDRSPDVRGGLRAPAFVLGFSLPLVLLASAP
jgi:hypothetical protein